MESAATNQEMTLHQRGAAGDPEALAELRAQHHEPLLHVLMRRGARPHEAEELMAALWSECVAGAERPSLLQKFSGRCALRGWLQIVATNLLIDFKRRQRFEVLQEPGEIEEERLGGPEQGKERDQLLLGILRASLEGAFAQCPPESLLMLRLVHLHGLKQRELGQMWMCHESQISRRLDKAKEDIRRITLQHLRKTDPWLQLAWDDLAALCETQQLGFL